MIYVKVWSLKRGIIWPSEPLNRWDAEVCARQDWEIQREATPPLTQKDWNQIEIARGSYSRNRKGVA